MKKKNKPREYEADLNQEKQQLLPEVKAIKFDGAHEDEPDKENLRFLLVPSRSYKKKS